MYHFLVQILIGLGGTQRSRVRVRASGRNVFVHLQNRTRLKRPPYQFFWHSETFFENILMSPKNPLYFF